MDLISGLGIAIIPLLFGVMETNSFQSTFCEIEIFGIGSLMCDELQDSLTIVPGQNVDIIINATTDTITLSAPAVRTIFVQTVPNQSIFGNVTEQQIYFVSDGSIGFNVTESYP